MKSIKNVLKANKNLFLLGTLLLFSAINFAQEKALQGKITNIEDIEGIHVLNTTSRYNSVTDAFGNFSITATPLDTLLFSSVHYVPKKIEVTEAMHERGIVVVTLEKLINELDEVFLGSKLTGDLDQDIKNIKVKKQLNFKDVGIPGFEGEPEEKIPTVIGQTISPVHVNIDALYKHISGYYKKLRLQRKWENQNQTVASILYKYGEDFFEKAYGIPPDRTYDFLLFCLEKSTLQTEFQRQSFARALDIFKKQASVYLDRLAPSAEKKE